MNNFSGKTSIIARHEFLKTIKRREFLFMTFIFPLFFAGIIFLPTMLVSTSMAPSEDQTIGYIDMSGVLSFPESVVSEGSSIGSSGVKASTVHFVMYETSSNAREALQAGDISSYLIVPEDFLETGTIEVYSTEEEAFLSRVGLSSELSDIVINSLLKGKVEEPILNRVKDPVNIKLYDIGKNGEPSEQDVSEILTDLGLPFLTAFVLFFSIFSASGYLLRGVAEEKENRIMEILLSSITPSELLKGKILGLGAVGLLQIAIWLSVIAFGSGYALSIKIEPTLFLLTFVYFLLGFLLFASMMAGVGAVTSSLQESQQVAGIFTFVAAFPLIFMQIILTNPDSPLSVFLSLFPLTSPASMLARIGTSTVPGYQIVVSIFILILSIHYVILLSSRLFRTYLLMYGKRPKVREILKNIRIEER